MYRHSCFEHVQARYVIQMVLHWHVENPTKRFCRGLSCVSCVYTKVHMSTHTSVEGHRAWMTTQSASFISVLLRPYHRDAPLSPDKTCYLVMRLAKVFRTTVHMSSRNSVQNHWHFDHYLQSLCLPVLYATRNRTKIVSSRVLKYNLCKLANPILGKYVSCNPL